MSSLIRPQPGILDIAPYVGGQSQVHGFAHPVKLSSNENPFGPSAKAIAAYVASADSLGRYPSSDHVELRAAIGEVHGLDPDQIICGAGSDEIIAFLCQAYAGPGDEVLYTEHGFSMYKISALAAGATPVAVREVDRHTDVDNLLAACTDNTRLLFIANPNNPTGTMISAREVTRLAEGLPKHVLLVLDGAYAEYVAGFDGGAALVNARQNLVMTRTFSKIYGLGSLRIGWGYGPRAIIDVLNRIRGPFNLSTAAINAATAAVRDQDYIAECQAGNEKWRAWLQDSLAKIGIASQPAYGNFILADFKNPDTAGACDSYLKSQGLIVRRVIGYGLPCSLRMTVGDPAACKQLLAALTAFMHEA